MKIEDLTDKEKVRAILSGNSQVTYDFFYVENRRIFEDEVTKYPNIWSDVDSLIAEVSDYVLASPPEYSFSMLSSFSFRCTLSIWLKIVVMHYCRQRVNQ